MSHFFKATILPCKNSWLPSLGNFRPICFHRLYFLEWSSPQRLQKVLNKCDQVHPHTVVHTCPICSAKAPLYIDTTILELLTQHPQLLTVRVTFLGQLVPFTSTSPQHPVVDLVSPAANQDSDVFVSPHPVPGRGAAAVPKRRFSFSDLGAGCRRGSSYTRLSTVDLTVDSPC